MAKKKAIDPAKYEQQFIPEIAPKKNEPVHKAALAFAKLRNEYNLAKEERDAAADKLLGVMQEEHLTEYTYGSVTVRVEGKSKVKVKVEKES